MESGFLISVGGGGAGVSSGGGGAGVSPGAGVSAGGGATGVPHALETSASIVTTLSSINHLLFLNIFFLLFKA
jgi:hypothetical protein